MSMLKRLGNLLLRGTSLATRSLKSNQLEEQFNAGLPSNNDFMEMPRVTAIFKRKGSRNSFLTAYEIFYMQSYINHMYSKLLELLYI